MTIDLIFVTHRKKEEVENTLRILDSFETVNVIFTGLDASASVNRNYGLYRVSTDIFIMVDDDISGYYPGWVEDLIAPLLHDEKIGIISARLMDKRMQNGFMMGDNRIYDRGVFEAEKSNYRNYRRLTTACLAIRKNDIFFDIGFVGSGYEDTCYFNRFNEKYPEKKIMINNNCKLIHHNEMKNQGGKYWEHNKRHYLTKYPDDPEVINQGDLTGK